MCDAWVEDCVSYTTVGEWIQRFNQDRTSIEDHPRSGRPVTEATDCNIEVIRALIDENPLISIRYMVFEASLSYGSINRIIHDALKLKKLCGRCIPRQLTEKTNNNECKSVKKTLQNWNLVNGVSVTLLPAMKAGSIIVVLIQNSSIWFGIQKVQIHQQCTLKRISTLPSPSKKFGRFKMVFK